MPIHWSSVVIGALAGLAAGVVGAVPLLAFGIADTDTFGGQAVLILIGFTAQFIAGYTAARIAGYQHPLHGSLGSLTLFALVSGFSIVTGNEPPIATLIFGAVVAMVLGTAAGVLSSMKPDTRD